MAKVIYKYITKDGSKVKVDSAERDGSGKKIDTHYSTKDELALEVSTREQEIEQLRTSLSEEVSARQSEETNMKADILTNANTIAEEKNERIAKDEDLQQQITNISSMGRYLSGWDCVTGKPTSEPTTTLPYEYKNGDYYIVAKIDTSERPTNYIPSGTEYDGTASTTVSQEKIEINNIFMFNGSVWEFRASREKDVEFSTIAGEPTDNVKLAEVLSNKTDTQTTGENGISRVFNEVSGGGIKFEHNDGTASFIGVNDGGEDGLVAQIYADKLIDEKWFGSKLDIKHNAMYYSVGDKSLAERAIPENELAVKGDIMATKQELQTAIDNKLDKVTGATTNKQVYSKTTDGTQSMSDISTVISSTSTNEEIASAKAVYDYIQSLNGEDIEY